MTYINPLANALPQSFATQQQLSADKTRQIRKAQVQTRNGAAETDQFEHQVEGAEEVAAIHEEAPNKRDSRKKKRPAQDPSAGQEPEHIDLTA